MVSEAMMSFDVFLALIVFTLAGAMTPGPNNFMLMASGVNFGFYRTIPHMLGIQTGFLLLLFAVGFGLGAILLAYPAVHIVLKIVGGIYLLYLAWRIGSARSLGESRRAATNPMTFWQAAAFQWVNPKGWVMAVSTMAIYVNPLAPFWTVMIIAAVNFVVGILSVTSWTGFGLVLRGFLADPVRLKWFNITMGVALAASLYPMLS